jgi:hypothetical protein
MAGFNSVTGDESIIYCDNMSFDGTQRSGKMTADGELFIGNANVPHIRKGMLTSPGGTIAFGYSAPNITADLVGSGFRWIDTQGSNQNLTNNFGYVTNRALGIAYILPVSANIGDTIRIAGFSGIWTVAQNASQVIKIGTQTTTTGITGSLTANNEGDCIELLCVNITGVTTWRALSVVGTITLA